MGSQTFTYRIRRIFSHKNIILQRLKEIGAKLECLQFQFNVKVRSVLTSLKADRKNKRYGQFAPVVYAPFVNAQQIVLRKKNRPQTLFRERNRLLSSHNRFFS